MTVWRMNTNDRDEHPLPDEGRRPLRDRAAATYSEEYLDDARGPAAGDTLLMYLNDVGFIAFGTVLSDEPTVVADSEAKYYHTSSTENHIDVVWHYRLPSETAISPNEAADLLGYSGPAFPGTAAKLADDLEDVEDLVNRIRELAREDIERPEPDITQPTIESDGYHFNLAAVHSALWLFGRVTAEPTADEAPVAAEALVEYFCDWGPYRGTDEESHLSALDLSDDEAEATLETWTTDIANELSALLEITIEPGTIAAIGREIGMGTFPDLTYDYLLNYLWDTSAHLAALDPDISDGPENIVSAFDTAFDSLPQGLFDYWKGRDTADNPINEIRAKVLEAHLEDRLTQKRYTKIIEEVTQNHERNITQGWRDFTILGGVYYHLLKLRVKHHFSIVGNVMRTAVGDESLETSIIDFMGSVSKIKEFGWLCLYPGDEGETHKDNYQIYLGFHHDNVKYGLHVGSNIRDTEWRSLRDLDSLERPNGVIRIDRVRDKIEQVKPEFDRLTTYGTSIDDDETIVPVETLNANLESDPITGLHFPDTMDDSLASLVQKAEAALNSGNHIIFTGPPGTGKTELAEQLAQQLVETYPELYTGKHLTTATADWSTFETVGGYMPARDGEGELEFRPGQLLRRWKRNGHQQNDLTVIDEINRANIDKAFGQLFTVLSGQQVELPYETQTEAEISVRPASDADRLDGDEDSQEIPLEEYVVPKSWRLMATMNSYDKTSLYDMSYAFMRRFTFIRVDAPPIPDSDDTDPTPKEFLNGYLDEWDDITLSPSEPVVSGVIDAWRIMNQSDSTRSLGPAIVKDMLSYVQRLDHNTKDTSMQAAADAIVAYAFPQLEGMIDRDRKEVINSLADASTIDGNIIQNSAADQFRG